MVRYLNSIWPGKVNEHTASRLCIFSIDLQVEEKFDLVDRVSHQAIVLQFILELAKSLKIDPRGCFRQFFIKFAQTDNPEYHKAFNDELEAFRGNIWLIYYDSYFSHTWRLWNYIHEYSGRVRERAEARIEAYLKEHEEEEKAKRIAASPGGLGRHQIYNEPLEFNIYQVK